MSKLGNVRRGRLPTALRFLFYGVEGVGKSSLAADAPEPIYLDLEDGTAQIDCARYPFRDGPGGHIAQSYAEILSALDDLIKAEHSFQTVVIDTIDRLEPLLWAHICERDSRAFGKPLTGIESYGYGRGYQVALDEWRALGRRIDELRTRRGMHIVMVGHAQVKTFKDPEGQDYDRYSLRVHEKSSGFLREWCDVLGFCCFEARAQKLADESGRVKGYSTGRRLVRLERTAAYDAKSRIPLPQSIELTRESPWAPINDAIDAIRIIASNPTPESIHKQIDAELARIGDAELSAKVNEVRQANGDITTLIRVLNRLKQKGQQQ